MQQITLFTVEHTGTNFVQRFFESLNIPKDNIRSPLFRRSLSGSWWRYHAGQKHLQDATIINALTLVVTARDPHLGAIRFLANHERRTLDEYCQRWTDFFRILKRREDYFIFDVGCRKEDRYQHLCGLAHYIGIDADLAVREYANAWQPCNSTETGAKKAYLETGALPDPRKGSWDMLDEAVAWYKNLPTNDY